MDRVAEEEVVLRDGARVLLREVRPSDRATIEAGWARLSETSRLFRFLGPRGPLTEDELRYLTDVDGLDHFAVGAVTRDASGVEAPVGVGRFLRRASRYRFAEIAITVVDAWQRRGVGRVLFERLLAAARRRAVDTLTADVHPENVAARRLIEAAIPAAASHPAGAHVRYEIPVP